MQGLWKATAELFVQTAAEQEEQASRALHLNCAALSYLLPQVIKANDDLTAEHFQFFLYQMLRGWRLRASRGWQWARCKMACQPNLTLSCCSPCRPEVLPQW